MKAVRIHQPGGVEALRYEDIPTPEPGAGEVRVKVEASGVNFIDIYYRLGQYKAQYPYTLGQEGAGVVDAVGAGVTGIKVGDRVAFVFQPGTYAAYCVIKADRAVPIPDNIDSQLAAAVMLQGTTAHYLAHSTYPLQPGKKALIHAAAGGTGALLVQVAKMCGAWVVGTVSTEEKAEIARDAGADAVILYTQTDFEAEVKRLTDGKGVDVVYDSVGKTTFDKSLNCLKPRGYLVLFGQSSGAVNPVDPQTLNAKGSLFLTRPSLGAYIADKGELLQRTSDVFRWIGEGKLKVAIDKTFPLAEAGAAHQYLEGRQSKGKVLLIP